jgi:beta-mannosidase
LNGTQILRSENMFVAHEIDVTALIKSENELLIHCCSLDKLLTARRPRPRWKSPMIENQQLRWFRTTVLGRTPGWSPPAAPVGPWRQVWLESRDAIDIDDVRMNVGLQGDRGHIAVDCRINCSASSIAQAELIVTRNAMRVTTPLTMTDRLRGSIEIHNPDLWWPHTHGEPALYDVSAQITLRDSAEQPLLITLGASGFRTVQLNQADDGFEIQINGERIFCRGACWTPLDIARLHTDRKSYAQTLERVCSAGMNMLRIGGTMVYESDDFLDLCDSLGILVWQEFMFANMDFPEDDLFIESAQLEARQVLSRLQGRPCLTVLCGNSEVEQQAAMWGATRERWSPKLFHETLPAIARELCADVPYWSSSAHGGAFPHQPNAGTTSYYGVGAYLRPLDDARRSDVRFATECLAFSNVPEDSNIAAMPGGLGLRVHHPQWKARSPRDLGASWDFEDVRDFYLRELFDVDPMELRYRNHDRYLELSRIVPGEAMASAFGEWRRSDSACGGALVWFLTDLWNGAGWGVIDAQGRPKAPYYYLKHALQPIAVSISDEGLNGLYVRVLNEHPTPLTATLEISIIGRAATPTVVTVPIALAPRSTYTCNALEHFDHFNDLSYAYRFGPAGHEAVCARLVKRDSTLITDAWLFQADAKATAGSDPGLTATANTAENGNTTLTITASRLARSISIDTGDFIAEDQYFNLAPGQSRQVQLLGSSDSQLRGTVKAINSESAVKIEILT